MRFVFPLAISSLQWPQGFLGSLGSGSQDQDLVEVTSRCNSPELSCHNTSIVSNLCCFNAPGGTFLQTQFWDAHPPTGPVDSWTIHGLWPDNCDGTYEAYCDDTRDYRNITQILQASNESAALNFMQTHWKDYKGNDEQFWEHEWNKHGTCISTLRPDCFADYTPTQEIPGFFRRVVSLFESLPTYEWLEAAGIIPSHTATYSSTEIQEALSKHHHGREIRLGCHAGALNEVWYFFNVRGTVQSGEFLPTDRVGSGSTCPRHGIKYLPKISPPSPTTTSTATTTSGAKPTSTKNPDDPISGRGFLNVVTSGSQNGCVISEGFWYKSGSCATFTATPQNQHFLLKSSKGRCGVEAGQLVCGRRVEGSPFAIADGGLTYNGTDTFYADAIPHGRIKGAVYTDPTHSVALHIHWQQR